MKTRIQKWGNSLAVRIPKTFAIEAGLDVDSPIKLSLSKGKLVIEPAAEEIPKLEELLKGITKNNLHGEWDTGPAVGRESW